MAFLGRTTEVALDALQFLAANPTEDYSVVEIALSLEEPEPFVRGILFVLKSEGFVKGSQHGYRLVSNAEIRPLLDVADAFRERFKPNPLHGDRASYEITRRVRKTLQAPIRSVF